MSSTATTHVKLGLLALAALAGVVAAGLGLGLRGARSATIMYHTYFDESVQGLDVGAPVKYRGVRIGNAATIEIAPDRKHVDVGLALLAVEVRRLGFAEVSPQLRAQLATQGVTGVKFVEIDFGDPVANPAPPLPFPPDPNYVPARASIMKGLLDNLEAVGPRLPELVDRTVAAVTGMERVLDDVRVQRVPQRIAELIDGAGAAAADVRRLAQNLDRARLGDRAAGMIGSVDSAAGRLAGVLDRIDGDRGLIASAHRAVDSIGDVGVGASGSAAELERTLRQIGDAALALRELVEAIDRDPDMLVKGRARTGRR